MTIVRYFDLVREEDRALARVWIRPADERAIELFESRWTPLLREMGAQDVTWPWRAELSECQAAGGRALETGQGWEILALTGEDDDALHGLFSLKQPVTSHLVPAAKLIYVERVAVAPWNRIEAKPRRRALGCGAAMLRYTVERSIELGFGGRVGLHSLDDAHTHVFYERAGMRHVENEVVEEGKLRYYEFDDEGARSFVERAE